MQIGEGASAYKEDVVSSYVENLAFVSTRPRRLRTTRHTAGLVCALLWLCLHLDGCALDDFQERLLDTFTTDILAV